MDYNINKAKYNNNAQCNKIMAIMTVRKGNNPQ